MIHQCPYLTVRDIARETGHRIHQIKYALDACGIREAQRVGVTRLFTREQMPQIVAALARTTCRRVATIPATTVGEVVA